MKVFDYLLILCGVVLLTILIVQVIRHQMSFRPRKSKSKVDEQILQESKRFREVWAKRLRNYPELIPDLTWQSLWGLDYFCFFLRHRGNWDTREEEFIRGLSAHLAEYIYTCWLKLSDEVIVKDSPIGILCIAKIKSALTKRKDYVLPVQQTIKNLLEGPRHQFIPLGAEWFLANDDTNYLGSFATGACFGMSPYGVGEWADLADKSDLRIFEHIEPVEHWIAQTAANYYRRVYNPSGVGADCKLYQHNLIWPPRGYSEDQYCQRGAGGIWEYEHTYEKLSVEELLNLVKYPDDTTSGAATVHLLWRLTEEDFPRIFAEICFNRVLQSAGGLRYTAIQLAQKNGVKLDWRITHNKARFNLEKRMSLLPLVYLSFEECIAPENTDLIDCLVDLNVGLAMEILEDMGQRGPTFLLQKAMLLKIQNLQKEAQECFKEIRWRYPHFENSEYFAEFGLICLNGGEVSEAINLLEAAVELDRSGRAVNNLAWAYITNGDIEKAFLTLEKAISESDFPVSALLNRAYLYDQLRQPNLARRDVRAAVRLYPFNRRCVLAVMRDYFA